MHIKFLKFTSKIDATYRLNRSIALIFRYRTNDYGQFAKTIADGFLCTDCN